MKALIVGMGIGQLYHSVFSSLGYSIDTVDANPEKAATYASVDDIASEYDIAVICTPNFTHEVIARTIANKCKIVLVEKPGVQDSKSWSCLVEDFPNTRFMMVKNNQYRDEIKLFKNRADQSEHVNVVWNNKNRIPNPGSWFTTKDLSFGGVSRDLIPHMLSYYCVLTDFVSGKQTDAVSEQRHKLEDIDTTDYGIVNPKGTYNVDDYCLLHYNNNNAQWRLKADWKSGEPDDVYISFSMKNSAVRYSLGLCPESAYKTMVETAVKNLNNNEFWDDQLAQDLWIHEQIENL
jgi:predicted dehydrogenase